MIGRSSADAQSLERMAADLSTPDQFGQLGRRLAGSFHLVASIAGHVGARGTALGLRRLFRTRTGNVPIIADRSDVLSALVKRITGSKRALDTEQFTLGLLGT